MTLDAATLVPAEASTGLQNGYTIRPLSREDYENGVLDVLTVLTTVGSISKAEYDEQWEYWNSHRDTYFPMVITDETQRVVACGMLVVERKLIHARGLVGHIEDIAVAADQQGLSLGRRLIQTLTHIGRGVGCYKVILDCDEKNVAFYEKCGYSRAGVEMSVRF